MIWAIVVGYIVIAALSAYFGLRWLVKYSKETMGGYIDYDGLAPIVVLYATIWPVTGVLLSIRWIFLRVSEGIWDKYGEVDE